MSLDICLSSKAIPMPFLAENRLLSPTVLLRYASSSLQSTACRFPDSMTRISTTISHSLHTFAILQRR
ncbi:hypothetical protein FRX31_031812 [Thalictrum thalictroides]|uniref:Uncharacterized protein n=1 Tax=Thalictrum thalictroides TaxID=46969 RepID=A0A7J6V1E4_THATH|nr:hypothetical protein FRX31_031812 [Thalictrum thalictroides]